MLTPAKRLKERIATNETVVGVMATDHLWPQLVEACQATPLAEFPVLMRTVSSRHRS